MKLKKLLLVLSIFLVTLMPVPVLASNNDLQEINIEIYLNRDGGAVVKETWTMEAIEGTENYKAFNNLDGTRIDNFSVVDETGVEYQYVANWDINASRQEKKNKCGIIKKGDSYELCYGIGDYGLHTYTMTYTLTPFVNQYSDAQGFNWQLINQEMDPKPNEFKVVIRSDYQFYDQDTDIWAFGYQGQVVFDNQGAIVLSNRDLNNNSLGIVNYVNILVRVPEGIYVNTIEKNESFETVLDDAKRGSSYQEESSSSLILALAGIGVMVFMIFAGVITAMVIKVKNDNKLYFSDGNNVIPTVEDVDPFRDIPCNRDIYYFYYVAYKAGIIQNDDRSGILCAMLLKWIRDGYVNFAMEEGKGWFKKDKYAIDFSHEIPTINILEEKMLGYFRAASGDNQLLENKEFERWCQKNYEEIEDWFKELIEYEEKLLQDQGLMQKQTTYKPVFGFKVKGEKAIYDSSFRDDIIYTKGLKRFLLDFSSIDEKEVIEVKLWEEYLMFASILGIAQQVEKQIGRLCPNFNQYSNIDYTYTMLATRTFMYNGVRSAAVYSSSGGSSSFGGGGGGFSGGGGGGSR